MTNKQFEHWLTEHGYTQAAFAAALSELLGETVSHITVNAWVTGRKRGAKKRVGVAARPPRWLPFVLPHLPRKEG